MRTIRFTPIVSTIFISCLIIPILILFYSSTKYSSEEINRQLVIGKKDTKTLGEVSVEQFLKKINELLNDISHNQDLIKFIENNNYKEIENALIEKYDSSQYSNVDFLFFRSLKSNKSLDISSTLYDTSTINTYLNKKIINDSEDIKIEFLQKEKILIAFASKPILNANTGKVEARLTSGIVLNNNQALFQLLGQDSDLIDTIILYKGISVLGNDEVVKKIKSLNISENKVSHIQSNLYVPFSVRSFGDEDLKFFLVYNSDSFQRQKDFYWNKVLFIFIFIIVMGGATFLISSRLVTAPLKELVEYAKLDTVHDKLNEKKFGIIHEFHELGNVYYQTFTKLEKLNKGLEFEVSERTRELENQRKEIQSQYDHVVSLQEKMIAQERLTSMGILLAGVSHELKNPLNIILNSSHIVKDKISKLNSDNLEKTNEDLNAIKDLIEILERMSIRSTKIIESMLEMSTKANAIFKLSDLTEVIDMNLKLYLKSISKSELNHFDIIKEYQFQGEVGLYEREFSQVLINLIQNSYYALTEKAKKISDYHPKITIRTREDGKFIVIEVEDNGIGIPNNEIDLIFNAFQTSKPAGEGTGLGLSFSRDIVKKHDGEIKVESVEGSFTKFIISIPKKLSV